MRIEEAKIMALLVVGSAVVSRQCALVGAVVILCAIGLRNGWDKRPEQRAEEPRPQKDLIKIEKGGQINPGKDGEAARHPSRNGTGANFGEDSQSQFRVEGRQERGPPRIMAFRMKAGKEEGQNRDSHGDGSSSAASGSQSVQPDELGAVQLQVEELATSFEVKLNIKKKDVTQTERKVPKLPEEGTTTKGGYVELTIVEAEPWRGQPFQSIQTSSKDVWDLSCEGWAIHQHRSERKRPFHPVHPSTPFDVQQLSGERATCQLINGKMVVSHDEWTDPR